MKKAVLPVILSVAALMLIMSCESVGTPEITVKAPKIAGKTDIAVFMLIFNDGNGSDTLIGCSIREYPSVRGEIHDVIDGVMTEIGEIKVPAKGEAILERGSLHLMFFGLPEEPGEITVNLHFRKSGIIEVKIAQEIT